MPGGALTMGANTTDRVDLGVVAAAANLSALTYIVALKPNALVDAKGIFTFGITATIQSQFARLSGTSGNVEFFCQRATTNTQYITSSNPLASTTAWKIIAFILNLGASANEVVNILHGTPGIAAGTECTYGTQTDGSGALTSNTGSSLILANRNLPATPDRSWQGGYGVAALFGAAFTPAQFASWCHTPRKQVGSLTAIEFGRPALDNTATWKSYCGNTPTLSGGVATNGPRMNLSRLRG